jgi:hypothetical protein
MNQELALLKKQVELTNGFLYSPSIVLSVVVFATTFVE